MTDSLAVGNADLRCEGTLGESGERGEHLARLAVVAVDALLPEQHDLRLFLVVDRLDDLRDSKRLNLGVGLHQNRAIGAERETRTQLFLAVCRTHRDRDDFRRDARFLQADGFFDRDFAERVYGHFDVGEIDSGLVRFDAHLHIRVDDAFNWNQYLHLILDS